MEFEKKGLIYIADDRPLIRLLLREFFNDNFLYNVKEYANGKELEEALRTRNSNLRLVITDNNMPEINGLDVIKRWHLEYPKVPFILMSGYNIRNAAFEAGAKDFIEKPFSLDPVKPTHKKYL